MRRILWLRRDLRATDHPLLALEGEILPIFIFDPAILGSLSENDCRVGFIFETLIRLKTRFREIGRDIALFYGDPTDVFDWILSRDGFDEVAASGDYDGYALKRDRNVSHRLPFNRIHDTYLFAPDEILKHDGSPYLVFTPYYTQAKKQFRPDHMREYPHARQTLLSYDYEHIHRIEGKGHSLLPLTPDSIGFTPLPFSCLDAEEKLSRFSPAIAEYAINRDFPALESTSLLSTDLRFGTVSIRRILRWMAEHRRQGIDTEPFFRELVFREFYAMLLYHFPDLTWKNFRYPFTGIGDETRYRLFCEGKTGVPIVDAGIRELLQNGTMHNRVRMIVASFCTKNLLLPWQWGEAFFARHLLDYDAASNILSWQWSSGTGIDPQPYFRIFNPYTQTKKFDPEGVYIKRWLPELRDVPASLFSDEARLKDLDIPGYPKPMVDHKTSSQKALEYFRALLK